MAHTPPQESPDITDPIPPTPPQDVPPFEPGDPPVKEPPKIDAPLFAAQLQV